MKSSINVQVGNFGMVTGNLRNYEKGGKGWYANGKVSMPVGDTFEPINILVDGQLLVAKPKAEMSESGNFGWYCTGKVTIDGQHVQVGMHLTACKCMGVRPANTVVMLQIGAHCKIYTPKKAQKAASKPTKAKKPALVAAKAIQATTVASPAPVADPLGIGHATSLEEFLRSLGV